MDKPTYATNDILLALVSNIHDLKNIAHKNNVIQASERLDRLRAEIRSHYPGNPAGYGWKSYSQNDEDGIIRYCLQQLNTVTKLNKTFVEIGIGAGYENNGYQLLLDGFTGCWIDGNHKFISQLTQQIPQKQNKLLVQESFITLQNIGEALGKCVSFLGDDTVDFFSLDVDGNDYYFLRPCIEQLKPKLVCVEYNGKFPPPSVLYMKYNPTSIWDRTDYQGASLQAMVNAMPDYKLVACSAVGINAFFVRSDLCGAFKNYSVEELYQPARMELLSLPQGHPPAYTWLRQVLTAK